MREYDGLDKEPGNDIDKECDEIIEKIKINCPRIYIM
jgi:hypothetical protein